MAKEAKRLTGSDHLCLAGGVALNCVSNGKLLNSGIYKDIFITPPSGDAGGALGAALAGDYIYFNTPRKLSGNRDELQGSYLGNEITDDEVNKCIKKYKAISNNFYSAHILLFARIIPTCNLYKQVAPGRK